MGSTVWLKYIRLFKNYLHLEMTGAQATGPGESESSRGGTKSHPATTSLTQARQLQALLLLGDAGGEGHKQEEVQEDQQEQEQDDHSWHWSVARGEGQHPHFLWTAGVGLPGKVSAASRVLCLET